MKILASDRVFYTNNPLVEVLVQVRFDRIEQLLRDVPTGLRERLANAGFKQYAAEASTTIQIAFGSNVDGSAPSVPPAIPTIHHFTADDQRSKFSLCADFVTFSSLAYVRWEYFRAKFISGLTVFLDMFPEAAHRRIGLRYKDLIDREPLGLEGVPWTDLLSPIVAGVFASQNFSSDGAVDEAAIEQQFSQVLIRLDTCKLMLQSALLRSTEDQARQAVLIDADFFLDLDGRTLSVEAVAPKLETLHADADALFRHCIKERLHVALGPRPI